MCAQGGVISAQLGGGEGRGGGAISASSESKQWRQIKQKPVSLLSQMVETQSSAERRERRVCFHGCPRQRRPMRRVNCESLKDFSPSNAPLIASLWKNCDVRTSEVRLSVTASLWPLNQSVLLIMQTAVCPIKLLLSS